MQLFTLCIFTFALAVCYVKANDHAHSASSSTIAPEKGDLKKREDGPPHPTPRDRRSLNERNRYKRQVPPNEPVTMHTPTPSRRKRSNESASTAMVHPIVEQADEMAEAIEESEAADAKKREAEESANASNDVEEEETTATTTESAVEKRDGDDAEGEIRGSASEDVPAYPAHHISRAKRVSHAGSSHKNRPSAVNRLQSNSNVGENNEEEDQKEHEQGHDFQHQDYDFDHMHTD
jgi:hypothetical protein